MTLPMPNHDAKEAAERLAVERMAAALNEHIKDCIYARFDGVYCMGCNFYKDHAALEHYRRLIPAEQEAKK